MQLPVFYPGKWFSYTKRILKYTRYKNTPFCFVSFRYDKYHSYIEFKNFINEVCKDHPIEKFYETLWFFITQISVYVKNNKICSLIWLYNFSMIYYFAKHHDSAMLLFMYLSLLFLAGFGCVLFECASFQKNEAKKLVDICKKLLDKKENANE